MVQVEADPPNNLLRLVFSQRVTAEELHRWAEKLPSLLAQLKSGFRLWSDFTGLESMEPECAPDVERVMDLCNEAGVAKVVRVIPDPRRDIGLNIMSLFHYRRRVLIVTCETVPEGLAALAD